MLVHQFYFSIFYLFLPNKYVYIFSVNLIFIISYYFFFLFVSFLLKSSFIIVIKLLILSYFFVLKLTFSFGFQNSELNVSKNCNGQSVTQEKRSSYRAREMGALEIAAEQVNLS